MVIRRVDGFSLIECLLYVALTGFSTLLFMSFVGQIMSFSIKSCERSDRGVELFVALAFLARDIRDSSSQYSRWRLAYKHELGLPLRSWKLSRGSLMRTERGVSALVARGLDDFSYDIEKIDQRVMGVRLRLRRGGLLVTQYVCVPGFV